jgi:hypothetical protein
MNHGTRFEDVGLGQILKYLPLLVLVFTLGGWYESAKANVILSEKLQVKIDNHEHRLTQVEDAVISLNKIVEWQDRHRH